MTPRGLLVRQGAVTLGVENTMLARSTTSDTALSPTALWRIRAQLELELDSVLDRLVALSERAPRPADFECTASRLNAEALSLTHRIVALTPAHGPRRDTVSKRSVFRRHGVTNAETP